jgi:outer membrane protein TolC
MNAVHLHREPRCVWLGALLGLVVVAGCATGPDSRYRDLGREWESARAAEEPAANDGDPLAGVAELERAQLVRLALARNPGLRAAHFAWLAALERYPQATALGDPTFGYALAPRTVGSSDFDPSQRFELGQRLPFPGKRALAGSAALADAEAAQHDFASARLRLAALASTLFDEYYLAVRALAINGEHAHLLQVHASSALARYASGAGSQQDPLQAEVELALLAQRDLELENQLEGARARINALLHRRSDLPLPPPPAELVVPELPALEAQVADGALEARPDRVAAEARVRAREAELAQARRAFLPDVTLMGVYDRLWEESELRPMLGFEIELPLQIRRRRAGVREAEARVAQARNEAARLADETRLELTRARQELERARKLRALLADVLLPTARQRIAAARAGFESGRNGFGDLVESEHELRNLRLAVEEALVDESRRSAELLAALGRLPVDDGGR